MDDRLEQQHDFRKTIKEAAEFESDGKTEAERERRLNNELAYTALAITSAMGINGFDETSANLMQLEMAQELMYLNDAENVEDMGTNKRD